MYKYVFCSFYTKDNYYESCAKKLKSKLSDLNYKFHIKEYVAYEGDIWSDITKYKIKFVADCMNLYPGHRIFWIDVDCELDRLPENILSSSADFIGFARGFSHPFQIGYSKFTRFWTPSFFGIAPTDAAKQFWKTAYTLLEDQPLLSATDDYFIEEAWRKNCEHMTFQVIPSKHCDRYYLSRKQNINEEVFFYFGDSGNVKEFKGRVLQHVAPATVKKSMTKISKKYLKKSHLISRIIKQGLIKILGEKTTHKVVQSLKENSNPNLRAMAQLKSNLTMGDYDSYEKGKQHFVKELSTDQLSQLNSLSHYVKRADLKSVCMGWWTNPASGNFGDWLGPYYLEKQRSVLLYDLVKQRDIPHIMLIGSIGKFTNKHSIVSGIGIADRETKLHKEAKYISLRGPHTAKSLLESGGPRIDRFGDPGVAIRAFYPRVRPAKTNGKVAFVPHFVHSNLSFCTDPNIDVFSVIAGTPQQIEHLISDLLEYDFIVTSAMHIMIACHSYGVPVKLVSFEGKKVHGDGIKYIDYFEGMDLPIYEPIKCEINLRSFVDEKGIQDVLITQEKVENILRNIEECLNEYDAL